MDWTSARLVDIEMVNSPGYLRDQGRYAARCCFLILDAHSNERSSGWLTLIKRLSLWHEKRSMTDNYAANP